MIPGIYVYINSLHALAEPNSCHGEFGVLIVDKFSLIHHFALHACCRNLRVKVRFRSLKPFPAFTGAPSALVPEPCSCQGECFIVVHTFSRIQPVRSSLSSVCTGFWGKRVGVLSLRRTHRQSPEFSAGGHASFVRVERIILITLQA